MDPTRIGPLFSFDNEPRSGFAVVAVDAGGRVYRHCHGMSNIELTEYIFPRTPFELASCSKMFTALAVANAIDLKMFSLDSEVNYYLPDIAPGVMIRDMLWHVSGLPEYLDYVTDEMWPTITNKDIPKLILGKEYHFDRGVQYEYCNTNYVLLALLVEKTTGVPFSEFMSAIFDGLGMRESYIYTGEKRTDLASMYNRARGYTNNVVSENMNLIVGDGGVWSTCDDMKIWLNALGTPNTLSNSIREIIFTEGKLNNGELIGYGGGMGMEHSPDGIHYYHEGGWDGFASYVVFYRDGKLGVAVLSNDSEMPVDKIADKVASCYFDTAKIK